MTPPCAGARQWPDHPFLYCFLMEGYSYAVVICLAVRPGQFPILAFPHAFPFSWIKFLFNMRIYILAAFSLLASIAFAQNNLSGTILDQTSGEQLVGVSIVMTDLKRSVSTDQSGQFQIKNLPSGISWWKCATSVIKRRHCG